jgi:hypothetical protein
MYGQGVKSIARNAAGNLFELALVKPFRRLLNTKLGIRVRIPTLPYPTLPYPTLPYPTLPYPTLPYPTLENESRGIRVRPG